MRSWSTVTLESVTADGTEGLRRGPFGGAIKKEIFVPYGFKIYEQKHAIYGDFDAGEYFIEEHDYRRLKSFAVKTGDMLVSCSGTLGRVAIVPSTAKPGIINQALLRIRPKLDVVSPPFFKMLLETPDLQASLFGSAGGSAIKNVRPLSAIRKVEFHLPPLAEQRRIAEVLDGAETLRAKRRAALAELDSFTQSLFLDLFGEPATNPKGWSLVRLGEQTTKIGSGSTPTGGETAYRTEGISLIRSLNVRDGEFTFKDLAHIGDEQAAKLAGVVVEDNDVLLNITGASVARVCRAPSSVLPARVNQHVCIIRPKPTLNTIFLEQFLLAPQTKRRLLKIGGAGATREAITKAQIEAFEAICPPISLQREFARRVRVVEKLKAVQRVSLAELDALFASLQYRAFRGEL